jgi:uncharacterized membrane protein
VSKGRLEAFSDGVIAIIITIMVLELHVPHGADWQDLLPLAPIFFCYVLSFVFIGIYWNNHHHLLQVVKHVDGRVLWANMLLLFWLSLVPFATAWMGENDFSTAPVAVYGAVLLAAAISFTILTQVLIALHGRDSTLGRAVNRNAKGRISLVAYAAAIPLAVISPLWSCTLFVLIALIWFIPDRRIEHTIAALNSSAATREETQEQ